ncbi:MAG: hypothetical protein NTZ85_01740 [Bacteroidia bacterium]|jgi:Tfp pilus assembly protein PilO|nr:hypothetical protein [Bacteroidia bacterium]
MVAKDKPNEVLKKGNKQYLFAITISLLIVFVIIAAFFLAIKPLYLKSKKISAELKVKQEQLQELKDKKVKLETLKDKEGQLKKDAENVKNALPSDSDVGRLFIQLDDIIKTSNGSTKSISGSSGTTTTAGTPMETITNSVGITTTSYNTTVDFPSYFEFISFLNKMENALRLVTINNINVSANESGLISTTLDLVTYTRK